MISIPTALVLRLTRGAPWYTLAVIAMLIACGSGGENTTSSGQGGSLLTGASSSSGSSAQQSASSSSASATVGGTGGSANSTTSGVGGSGGADNPCVDSGVGEPNETENDPFVLPPQDDCDEFASVSGTVAGTEEDWFRYAGNDGLCLVNPERVFTQSGGLTICKYFECNVPSATSVSCPSGTTPSTSPGNRPGCCSNTGFQFPTFGGFSCTGTTDDDAQVYILVRATNPNTATCADYSIKYAY